MKTKILKMVLPAFIIMMAVLSAYAFKKAEKKELLAPTSGWISLPGQPPCSTEVMCDDVEKPLLCTVVHQGVNYQAFGITSVNPVTCNKLLYRWIP